MRTSVVAQCSTRLLHITILEDSIHDILNHPNYLDSSLYHPLCAELMQTLEELRILRDNIMEIKIRAIQQDEKEEANKADENALGTMVKSLELLQIRRDDSVKMAVKKQSMAKTNEKQKTDTENPKTPRNIPEQTAHRDVAKPSQNKQDKYMKRASV
jgi:hypothetical protein